MQSNRMLSIASLGTGKITALCLALALTMVAQAASAEPRSKKKTREENSKVEDEDSKEKNTVEERDVVKAAARKSMRKMKRRSSGVSFNFI